jgi:chromosome segregation ATPase
MLQTRASKRAEDYEAEIARHQADLLVPRPEPGAIRAAISSLKTARTQVAPVEQQLREAIKEFGGNDTFESRRKIESLNSTLTTLKQNVVERARELAALRKDHQPAYDAALLPSALALRALAHELIDTLDATLTVLSDARVAAVSAGYEPAGPLTQGAHALAHVHALRRTLRP